MSNEQNSPREHIIVVNIELHINVNVHVGYIYVYPINQYSSTTVSAVKLGIQENSVTHYVN